VLRPFIDTLFGGKLASIIVCEECKHVRAGALVCAGFGR
jgi:hypothetical protein